MKTFKHYISESLNRPYKWKKVKSNKMGVGDKWTAEFVTENGAKYIFDATKDYGNQWEVWFKLVSLNDDNSKDINSLGVTGTEGSSAIRVFGTVKEIFEKFVKQKKPQALMFMADKRGGSERGSRAKLYNRFAKVFARENGYELETGTSKNHTKFLLYKEES